MTYRTIVRKQFIFVVNDQKLACLLTLNSTKSQKIINIVAMTVQKLENKNENYVRIIVGPNKLKSNNNPEYQRQVEQLVSNLKFLNIDYYENDVVQVLNAGTYNFYRIVLVALYCAGIPVRSYYQAEPLTDEMMSAIVDVPHRYINATVETIKKVNIADPESSLYINHTNINEKCLIINSGLDLWNSDLTEQK